MNSTLTCEISRRLATRNHVVLALLFLSLLAGTWAQTQPSPKPLSKDDVLMLLRGSVSTRRVEELARQRGIDFQITPEAENELHSAGADDGLLSTLKQLAPSDASTAPLSAVALSEIVQRGRAFKASGEYANAVQLFGRAAQQNDPSGEAELG